MSTTTINISMPEGLKSEVENILAKDGYGNVSEFFRDLVRNYLKEREQRELEALLLEGLHSGKPTPLTRTDFEKIKERGIKRLQDRKVK